MKIVVQRVQSASVKNHQIERTIQQGLCLLVGIGEGDTQADAKVLAKKNCELSNF